MRITGTVNGTNLSAGTQNATLWVAPVSATGTVGTSSSASVLIDPVLSRVINSVTAVNLGRVMEGATVASALTVTSTGAYANSSNLTMNRGSFSTSNSNGSVFTVSNAAATTYNGATTTSGTSSFFHATFSSSVSGPTSGTAAIVPNSGLFTGETLASGTPTLPTLNVPYTATVLQPRTLSVVSGGAATPISLTGGRRGRADFSAAPWCR